MTPAMPRSVNSAHIFFVPNGAPGTPVKNIQSQLKAIVTLIIVMRTLPVSAYLIQFQANPFVHIPVLYPMLHNLH